MRTTVDIPDPVFRRLKAAAALEGASLKQMILRAVEKELRLSAPKKRTAKFPLIRSKQPKALSLTKVNLDDVLFG